MTDQELNEAVARKLGGERRTLPDAELEDGTMIRHYPDYCHSIAAAWEIVEKILPDIVLWDQGKKWIVSRSDFQGIGETLAEADTAPLAICLAFLKLKEN